MEFPPALVFNETADAEWWAARDSDQSVMLACTGLIIVLTKLLERHMICLMCV